MGRPYIVGTPSTVFRTSGGTTQVSILKPTVGVTIQKGDWLVAFIRDSGATITGDYTSSGWTRVGPAFLASNAYRVNTMLIHKVTNPALEPSQYFFTAGSNGARCNVIMAVVRGAADSTPVSVASTDYDGDAFTNGRSIASLTVPNDNSLMLFFGATEFSSGPATTVTTAPSGMTLVSSVNNPSTATNVSRTTLLMYKQDVNTGATGVKSIAWGTNVNPVAQALVFDPGPDTVPTYVNSVSAQATTYSGSSTNIPLPGSRVLENLLVAFITMNGSPSMPPGWTLAYEGGNSTAIAYARVDGTTITRGSGALAPTFGNGGSAIYYSHSVVQVGGAIQSGNPFDFGGVGHYSTQIVDWYTTLSAIAQLNTPGPNRLILTGAGGFSNYAISGTTGGVTMGSTAANVHHVAYKQIAAAGAITGTYTYATGAQASYLGLVSIKPFVPIPTGLAIELYNGSGIETAYLSVWDGTTEVAASSIMALRKQTYTVQEMDADFNDGTIVYWGHRGASDNWPEMSMRGYTNAIWHGVRALEVSCWRTTDGVFVMSHDNDLVRATTGTGNITTKTWAEVKDTPIDLPTTGGVTGRLEEILDTYGQTHVLIVEDKQGTNHAALKAVIESRYSSPAEAKKHIIIKNYGSEGGLDDGLLWESQGYKVWAYFYDAEAASRTPAKIAGISYLGLNHDATATNWNNTLAFGKPVIAHVVSSAAQASSALGKDAWGLQVADVLEIVPAVNVI